CQYYQLQKKPLPIKFRQLLRSIYKMKHPKMKVDGVCELLHPKEGNWFDLAKTEVNEHIDPVVKPGTSIKKTKSTKPKTLGWSKPSKPTFLTNLLCRFSKQWQP
ncbi:unnamed protein product, partial [Amoebophrya sp. A25]